MRLGFLASHEGSTMQSVIDACKAGRLNADVAVVISNNSNARALLRASEAGIPAFHLSSRTHPDPAELDAAICQTLRPTKRTGEQERAQHLRVVPGLVP